jgi:hypothetical protein
MNIFDLDRSIKTVSETIDNLKSIQRAQVWLMEEEQFTKNEGASISDAIQTLERKRLCLQAAYLQECHTSTNPDHPDNAGWEADYA